MEKWSRLEEDPTWSLLSYCKRRTIILELLRLMIEQFHIMAVLLPLLVLLLSLFGSSATSDPLYFINNAKEKFSSNSTYSSNLNLLFSSLSSHASATAGFAATSSGRIPDSVYGLTLCRGDTDTATCRSCINTAISGIQLLCPNSYDAAIWYDNCELRYSNQDFLRAPNVNSDVQIWMYSSQNVSADQLFRFESITPALMGYLSDLAVRNTSRLFATGETVLTAEENIYGLVQCARDLSAGDCRKCLQGNVDEINKTPLKGRMGGRTLGIWCNMRFEVYKFYNGTSTLIPSSELPPSTQPSPSPMSPPSPSLSRSPSSLPSPSSSPSITQNTTHSPVDSSQGGSKRMDFGLAITIPAVLALVRTTWGLPH